MSLPKHSIGHMTVQLKMELIVVMRCNHDQFDSFLASNVKIIPTGYPTTTRNMMGVSAAKDCMRSNCSRQ